MKKITQNLRWLVTLLTMIVSVGAWAQAWVETDPSELVTGDIVVIADKTSSTAMSNDKGTSSAPLATAVTIEDEESGDVWYWEHCGMMNDENYENREIRKTFLQHGHSLFCKGKIREIREIRGRITRWESGVKL